LLRLACFALGLLACPPLVGCGGGKGDVSGVVKYKGTPLKGGVVTFVNSESGPSFTASINEDGTYNAPNVRAGTYKVCVETESLRPRQMGPMGGGAGSGKFGGPPKSAGPPDLISLAKSGKIKNTPPPNSEAQPPPPGEKMQDGLSQLVENSKRYVAIPPNYAKPETTDLSVTVTSGGQKFDIDLK
jgi:hypothetical protein